MSDNKGYGKIGEKITAEYLKKQGCIITKMNYRTRHGEIDIVAEYKSFLVFVEVKTREENSFISGEEAITPQKQMRIKSAAKHFLSSVDTDYRVRFDAAIVTVKNNDGKQAFALRYIKNAFM